MSLSTPAPQPQTAPLRTCFRVATHHNDQSILPIAYVPTLGWTREPAPLCADHTAAQLCTETSPKLWEERTDRH